MKTGKYNPETKLVHPTEDREGEYAFCVFVPDGVMVHGPAEMRSSRVRRGWYVYANTQVWIDKCYYHLHAGCILPVTNKRNKGFNTQKNG